jgi:hypothetical protein
MAVRGQEHDDEPTKCSENETDNTDDIASQKQRKSLTQEKLAGIFRAIEEIQQHTQGQVFEDPVEVIRKMREERTQELGQ